MIPQQPVEVVYRPGKTLYFFRWASGQVLNTSTVAYEAYNPSHRANYAIALPELGSGFFRQATLPAVEVATLPTDVVYDQAGVSPDVSDTPVLGFNPEGVNLAAINGYVEAAVKMALAVNTQVKGKATAGTLTISQMTSDVANVIAGSYVGRTILWTGGNLSGVAAAILGYDGAGKFSFSKVPLAPIVDDPFVVV